MARTKATFTLDPETLARLAATAARRAIPKSEVVRDAIRDFSDRAAPLSKGERQRLLEAFDCLVPAIPRRPLGDVARELAELRRARRARGPRHDSAGRSLR
jgi:hypothetical protein